MESWGVDPESGNPPDMETSKNNHESEDSLLSARRNSSEARMNLIANSSPSLEDEEKYSFEGYSQEEFSTPWFLHQSSLEIIDEINYRLFLELENRLNPREGTNVVGRREQSTRSSSGT